MATAVEPGRTKAGDAGKTGRLTRVRWWRWPAFAAAGILLLVAAAPWIASREPVRGWLVQRAARAVGLRGELSVSGASLGWFSPVRLAGISLADERGEPLLHVAELATSRTLAGLLWNRAALGSVVVEQPLLRVVYLEEQTNLEHVLGELLKSSRTDSEPTHSLTCRIEVRRGELEVIDPAADRQWKWRQVEALLALGMADAPLLLELQARPDEVGRVPPCRLRLAITPARRGGASSDGAATDRLECSLHRLPLEPLAPLLRRGLPEARLEGELSATFKSEWRLAELDTMAKGQLTPARRASTSDAAAAGASAADGPGAGGQDKLAGEPVPSSAPVPIPARGSFQGKLEAADFLLAAPALGPDAFRLEKAELPIDLRWNERQVEIRRLALQCEVGKLSLSGRLPAAEEWLAAASLRALAALGLRVRGACEAQIDVARLAALAPRTLRLREQTELSSGQVRVAIAADGPPEQAHWRAALEVTRLEALNHGRRVVWEAPLAMNLAAIRQKESWKVETLECHSDFLQLGGSGTLDDLEAVASFDLGPLAQQLGQIFDLSDWQLAGTGQARLTCKRLQDGALDASTELALQDVAVQVPGFPAFREPGLKGSVRATGLLDDGVLRQLDQAAARITAGGDRLSLRLLRPVADPLQAGNWPLDVELEGDAARWLDRVRPIVGSSFDVRCNGRVQLHASGKFGLQQGRLDEAALTWDRLELAAWGLHATEPRATVTAAGTWNVSQRRVELPEVVVRSSTVSGTVRGLRLAMPEGQPIEATGELDLVADLERLSSWLAASGVSQDWQAGGRARLMGTLRSSGTAAAADLNGRIDSLAVLSAGSPVWNDPRVDLTCKAAYLPDNDRVELTSLVVGGSTVQLDASGAVVDLSARPVLEAQGTFTYDARALARFLTTYVRSPVLLEENEPRAFWVRMPLTSEPQALWLAGLEGSAALGWRRAGLYGFAFGPAAAQARLAEGVLRVEPFEVAVNQGRVQLAPELHLAATPMLLVHGRGRIAHQVRITPEMCRDWLRYVAPIVAETTEAEGTFSIDLDDLEMPLDRPGALETSGRITLHSVQVAPTPLAQELGLLVLRVADLFRINLPGRRSADDLAALWSRPARVRLKRESQVSFRVAGGYVHHENVVMEFQDFSVRTRGSVGFDQTLSLVAEVPIQEEWLRSERLREAFAGKTLQLPVAGTLSRPKVDLRALERLASDFLRGAASDAIQGELNRQLDRLLRPRR